MTRSGLLHHVETLARKTRQVSIAFGLVLLSSVSAWATVNIPVMTWATHTVAGKSWPEPVRSDWLNVLDYGADPTGTADSTAAIQAAMNVASASHSTQTTVYLPAGTYKISSTLYWSTIFSSIQQWAGAYGLWLVGCGRNTTIQWAGAAGQPMLLDQGSSRSHYEGIVWNAGSSGSAAGIGVAHVSIALYQTAMRHENEAFIGFVGSSGSATLSPPYVYTSTTGTISTAATLASGVTTLPLNLIPGGLVVGEGIAGTGIVTGGSGATTTTVTAISTSSNSITISAATNHTITNGATYTFTTSVAGTPEKVPASGIFGGSELETEPMGETMIWNCLFQNDTTGVYVGYEEYNNYMWIFKNCEFDTCGTGINPSDGKQVIMDTHFSGSTTVDVNGGVTTRLRRCTSSGSKQFFAGASTGSQSQNVIEDCWVDSWTAVDGAISFGDRADMVFDCTFTNPPASETGDIYMSPSTELDATFSNNSTTSATVPVTYVPNGKTVNMVTIPAGTLTGNIASATQTFLQSAQVNDGTTVLDVTQSPYNAVAGTNCTTAIQSAINQAESNDNGTIVYIPAGQFDTTSTLNVSGSNYTIQGSGYISKLSWSGAATTSVPMVTVTTPQNIAIEQILLAVGEVSGSSSQPGISETSAGASYAVYDGVTSGANPATPPGIVLTSLPAGSTVLMPLCDSALTVNDCGPAVIFSNYLLHTGVSITGATQAKTGFLGALAMEGGQSVSKSGWDVTVNDNQDFIGCDYYDEQTYNHLLAENTDGATWTGRITMQGMKEESDNTPTPLTTIGIQNYGGRIFYGSQDFLNNNSQPVFTQTGSAAVDLDLIGEDYYSNPSFTLGSACNLIEANDIYSNPSVTYMANVQPTGWGTSAAASLDHFRQADACDLSLNYTALQAPSITNGPPPTTVALNTSYSFTYTTSGYPAPAFTVSSGSLPTGLTLTPAGVLSGTPTASGSFAGTVDAGNGVSPDATQNFSIVVQQAPSFTNGPPPTPAVVGSAYSFTYTTSGYPPPTFVVSSGSLPAGLALSSAGVVSGTPTATGTYTGTVDAANGVSPDATQNFSIIVQQAPSITNGPPPTTTVVGNAYSFSYSASGVPAPTFVVSSGSLPAGLTLTSAGVLSGTSTTAGAYAGIITASNGVGTAGTQNFSITVFSSFNSWANLYFTTEQLDDPTVGGPDATPENDGVANLLKYFYDINPTQPMTAADYAVLPTLGAITVDGTTYLTLTYREYALESGIVLNVQTSPDLQTWTPVTNPTIIQTGSDSNTGDPIMQVQFSGTGVGEFIRLNVTQP